MAEALLVALRPDWFARTQALATETTMPFACLGFVFIDGLFALPFCRSLLFLSLLFGWFSQLRERFDRFCRHIENYRST